MVVAFAAQENPHAVLRSWWLRRMRTPEPRTKHALPEVRQCAKAKRVEARLMKEKKEATK
jgi:hypothetical protein